jgi:hypothetical protein
MGLSQYGQIKSNFNSYREERENQEMFDYEAGKFFDMRGGSC